MTRVIGSIVVRNEKSRYLEKCLEHAKGFLDEIFVFDDLSTDGSAQLAADMGCVTVQRGESIPPFIEHEGNFRFGAWQAFEAVMSPSRGDWVFSFDADEFMVCDDHDIKFALNKATTAAAAKGCSGVVLPFPEIFKIEGDKFYNRVDGLWGTIRGPRLFVYREKATWRKKSMGCGSEPEYVAAGPLSQRNFGLSVLHLGYAKPEDVKTKYKRYSSLLTHGHSDGHINSIPKHPTLALWKGNVPDLGGMFDE